MKCLNCKHYHAFDGRGWGECRRYPPKVSNDRYDDDRFPLVDEAEWCGEYVLTDDRVAIGVGNIKSENTP